MKSKPTELKIPEFQLDCCSVEDHCNAIRTFKKLSYWWYQGQSRIFGNYSMPFRDENGRWWQQVKPGLCWPVESFKPIPAGTVQLPYKKSFVGYQYVTDAMSCMNSKMIINTIMDLENYGPNYITSKRRSKIRKGFSGCCVELLLKYDEQVFNECREVWNDLTVRTSWKKKAVKKQFDDEWRMLLDCPGTNILIARELNSGKCIGFYIVKIIDDTAYSDTIAVKTDKLSLSVNDILRYTYLKNASSINGVKKASSSIVSSIKGLEQFKRAIGFKPVAFPGFTFLRVGMPLLLKIYNRSQYERMLGNLKDDEIVALETVKDNRSC